MSKSLLVRREGRLARLTLNRPERRNALNTELCQALLEAIREVEADSSVGAILLDGADPVFCSGMDLKDVFDTDRQRQGELHLELFSVGTRLRKPMVAAVQGGAIGGGMGLALNAHLVVAASSTKFGLSETRLGLWPFTIYRAIARVVGERRATQLALSARIFGAEEALRLRIVDEVVTPAELASRARAVALEMAAVSARAVADGLEFVAKSRGRGETEVARMASNYREQAEATADFREGVMAFREKREPVRPPHPGED
ncbi:MAG: enoyl-CoA hydratase/isomerase family protein [bacterium]|nr:enoyl-CoA hydratase/isomerase family protein [bacterium]